MTNKDFLDGLFGETSGLNSIGDRLVAEADEREDRRMTVAVMNDALSGKRHKIAAISTEVQRAARQSLLDSNLPIVTAFDAYCIVKDASKALKSDLGLKKVSHVLYDRWMQDPNSVITVGELVEYRDRYEDLFPKSATKKVFDNDILAKAGFQTLTNLPLLNRIASQVTSQDSYESLVDEWDLAGDRPEQIRARAYVRSMAEFKLSDGAFETEQVSPQQAIDRAVARFAQMVDDEADTDLGWGQEDEIPASSDSLAPNEIELPHDENTEEMAEIESPVSGETLVVELGTLGVDGMEPDADEDLDQGDVSGDRLPQWEDATKMTAGLRKKLVWKNTPGKTAQMDPSIEGDDYNYETGSAMGASAEDESDASLEDLIEAAVMLGVPEALAKTIAKKNREEMLHRLKVHGLDETAKEIQWRALHKNAQVMALEPEAPMADSSDNFGGDFASTEPDMGPGDLEMNDGLDAAEGADTITMITDPTSGEELQLTLSKVEDAAEADAEMDESVDSDLMTMDDSIDEDSTPDETVPGASTAPKAASAQVTAICASMGLTPRAIEAELLDGESLGCGRYAVRIGNDDKLEILRLEADTSLKLLRSAAVVEMDEVITQFMALSASQFIPKPVKSAPKKVARVAKKADYIFTTDVPAKAPINAKRIMASIWKLVPDAEGEMTSDGRLAVLMRQVDERELNRVNKIVSDVYGVRNVEAELIAGSVRTSQLAPQQMDPTKQNQTTNMLAPGQMPSDNLAPETPEDSPFNGAPPVPGTVAGQPQLPQMTPMQTLQTGQQAQNDFVQRHTDPFAKTSEDCDEPTMCEQCGSDACDCPANVDKVAQMDEPMGEPMGMDEPMSAPMDDMGMDDMGMDDMGMDDMGMDDMGMGDSMGMDDSIGIDDPMDLGLDRGMGGEGQLEPQDAQAVAAAMQYFRDTGLMPLEALKKFETEYEGLLDKYDNRMMTDAAVIKAMTEAFDKDAVIPMKQASKKGGKVAFPEPKKKEKAKAPATVKFEESALNKIKPNSGAHKDLKGTKSKFKPQMSTLDTIKHKAPKKAPGNGVKAKDVFEGTDGNDSMTFGKAESKSVKAQSKNVKAKSKSVKASADQVGLYITLEDEFYVNKGTPATLKPVAKHASLTDALADAERRALGTNLDIFISDGSGGFDSAL